MTEARVDLMVAHLYKLFSINGKGKARPPPLLVKHAPARAFLDTLPELEERMAPLRTDPRLLLAAFPRTHKGWRDFVASAAFALLQRTRQPAFPANPWLAAGGAVAAACPASQQVTCLFDGLEAAQANEAVARGQPTAPATFADALPLVRAALIALRDDKENSQIFKANKRGYEKFRQTPEGKRLLLPVHPKVCWGWPTNLGYVELMSLPPQV